MGGSGGTVEHAGSYDTVAGVLYDRRPFSNDGRGARTGGMPSSTFTNESPCRDGPFCTTGPVAAVAVDEAVTGVSSVERPSADLTTDTAAAAPPLLFPQLQFPMHKQKVSPTAIWVASESRSGIALTLTQAVPAAAATESPLAAVSDVATMEEGCEAELDEYDGEDAAGVDVTSSSPS